MPTHASVGNNWANTNNDNSSSNNNSNNAHSPGQGTAVQGAAVQGTAGQDSTVRSAVGDTQWEADAAAVHEQLWQMVWRYKEAEAQGSEGGEGAGRRSFTATPEYVKK